MSDQEYIDNSSRLAEIIKPVRQSRHVTQTDWHRFRRMLDSLSQDYGAVELNPDFQRGHVWTESQQIKYVENVLRGVVSEAGFTVQFNCPAWFRANGRGNVPEGIQCIDGLQRITAAFRFLDGEIKPFGLTVDDLNRSSFSAKTSSYHFTVQMFDYEWKHELYQHYLDFNSAGTPHDPTELIRVAEMQVLAKQEYDEIHQEPEMPMR